MNIISGELRGRRLAVARGEVTRPTPARVREALFSILAKELQGADVLDLFAGSGALGLEALSRGARSAVFVERSKPALVALRKNLEFASAALGGPSDPNSDRCRLLVGNSDRALARLSAEGASFSLVFLDPPYRSTLLAESLVRLLRADVLGPQALVICEHAGNHVFPAVAGFDLEDSRKYSDVALSFLRLMAPNNDLPNNPELG